MPSRPHSSSTYPASSPASRRSPWFTWATASESGLLSRQARSNASMQTESAPPDTPATMRSPAESMPCSSI